MTQEEEEAFAELMTAVNAENVDDLQDRLNEMMALSDNNAAECLMATFLEGLQGLRNIMKAAGADRARVSRMAHFMVTSLLDGLDFAELEDRLLVTEPKPDMNLN